MRSFVLFIFLGLFFVLGTTKVQGQIFPKIIKKDKIDSVPTTPRKNIELGGFDQSAFLRELTARTDSMLFKNEVDLRRPRSIVDDSQDFMIWAPTNRLVKVSEQILIDSIWITAFEHYEPWDSQKIDIYDFDPEKFQDTVSLRLYDSFFGYDWKMPLETTPVTSRFGFRWGRRHLGTDLDLQMRDPIYAAFDGIVRIRSYDRYGFGYYVVIRHKNGLETVYGHMSKILVEVGQEVKAGEEIGKGGSTGRSTGSHLHYELRYRGLAFDPEIVYDFDSFKIKSEYLDITPETFGYIAQARSAVYHRVRRGETLGAISRRYRVPISQITRLSGISTRSILRIGQRLRIQ
ncbi:M23 family metallopeptidase [Algoriphagus sediminis]|uniref:M23 family metallopeptidase n=1 Tax=Algoriphagus sediminis TaxID=3057113 RepID=A0ABT7YCX9_9BACT|nr:M23 family metallopeptidase [Algoriphagus sediminis]MDN3204379.1 M23 family metallopeptidase [Algoriphagus sediminis]